MTELGISFCILCETAIKPSGESKEAAVGVRIISAPRQRNVSTFSLDIFSGITMIQRYPIILFYFSNFLKAIIISENWAWFICDVPLIAAAIARPIPVFPDVGSIIV